MNASNIHLALTHLPVVLSLLGMILLTIALIKSNQSLKTTSLYILVVAGVSALPVFFTGEGAEEVVEELPGVSKAIIERHETFARLAFFAILAAAVLSIAGLVRLFTPAFNKGITVMVLLISLVSTGLMAQTANLGGQIRHTEIRKNAIIQADNANTTTDKENEKEEDDD